MSWYYSKDAAQHGPVSLLDLQGKIQSGEVARGALVWREGMPDWTPVNVVAEIAPATAKDPSATAASVYAPPINPPPTIYQPIPNARPTSGLAITSLILGILGLTTCMLIPGIPAVICGHLAMPRTHPLTGNLGGRGLAIAGLIMGYICCAMLAFFLIYFVGIMGLVAAGSTK